MKKIILISCALYLQVAKAQTPTWSEDVACILYSHCTSCHNPTGAGPFSLVTYDEAYTFRNSIKYSIVTGQMPPWPPDENYRRLAHERLLSDEEVNLITDWVNSGAAKGDTTLAPVAPSYTTNYQIPSPDLVLKIPTYTVPILTSEDMYRCFAIPTGLLTDKYITGIEVTPGNGAIVHHVLTYYDTSSSVLALDAADPDPGYTNFGSTGSNTSMLIGGWVPGSSADFFPNGMGVILPANSNIILQIHYPVGSTGESDSTEIRFKFSPTPVRPLYMAAALEHSYSITNGPLIIPPNTIKTFHEEYTILPPLDGTFIGISPHAHLVCESMYAFAVKPGGDTIPLINIPKWDFHWQGTYYFQQPIKMPVGTTLHGYATYNNTATNTNGIDPSQWVFVGEDTQDEMMLFFFTYTYYLPGDENIVIDTSSHPAHYDNCETAHTSFVEEALEDKGFYIYPNPVNNNEITIYMENNKQTQLSVYTLNGNLCHKRNLYLTEKINLDMLEDGMYIFQLKQNEKTYYEKVIKL